MRLTVAVALVGAVGAMAAQTGVKKVEGLPGLNVTSLTVNAPEGQAARVVMGSGDVRAGRRRGAGEWVPAVGLGRGR